MSHNHLQGIVREAMWVGTRDYSPLLCAAAALDCLAPLGGLQAVMARNRAVLAAGHRLLLRAFGTAPCEPPCLRTGSMANVPLPPALRLADAALAPAALRDLLRRDYAVEVVVFALPPRGYLRVSCQLYNAIDDFTRLRDAVLHVIRHRKFEPPAVDALLRETALYLSSPDLAPPGPLLQPNVLSKL